MVPSQDRRHVNQPQLDPPTGGQLHAGPVAQTSSHAPLHSHAQSVQQQSYQYPGETSDQKLYQQNTQPQYQNYQIPQYQSANQQAADPAYQEYLNQYYAYYYPEYWQQLQQNAGNTTSAEQGAAHVPTEPSSHVPPAAQPAHQAAVYSPTPEPAAATAPPVAPEATEAKGIIAKLKSRISGKNSNGVPSKIKPMAGALIIGLLIYGMFNSQLIVGQIQYLISPHAGANASISDSQVVGPEPAIIIPKINVNVPVVYDEPSFEEKKVQQALERGVVHYGDTALPGQAGNNVIVGHSSNNWWASGKYKFAFVLLDKLELGDSIVLHYEGKRLVYEVNNKVVVQPNDLSVLQQNTAEPTVTLITCTPAGTSLRRLVIQAKQISPKPTVNAQSSATSELPQLDSQLPSNTPSLWEQLKRRFSGN